MLLRYIATVVAFSSLFPLASALPTVGTDATVSADLAAEPLGPSLGDVVTNLVAEIAACRHELQAFDPNNLTTPGADFTSKIQACLQSLGIALQGSFDEVISSTSPSLSSLMTNLLDGFLRLEPSVPNELNSPLSDTIDVLKDLLDTLANARARVSD